jgi:acetylornithine/N-succinyldiaminopimelate aminotransferase
MEEIAKPDFLPRVARTGAYLADSLERLSRRHRYGSVRGKGLLLALDLGREIGPAVAAEAMRRGLLINAPRPDCLRFMPALNVTHDEIDRMIDVLDATMEQIDDA